VVAQDAGAVPLVLLLHRTNHVLRVAVVVKETAEHAALPARGLRESEWERHREAERDRERERERQRERQRQRDKEWEARQRERERERERESKIARGRKIRERKQTGREKENPCQNWLTIIN